MLARQPAVARSTTRRSRSDCSEFSVSEGTVPGARRLKWTLGVRRLRFAVFELGDSRGFCTVNTPFLLNKHFPSKHLRVWDPLESPIFEPRVSFCGNVVIPHCFLRNNSLQSKKVKIRKKKEYILKRMKKQEKTKMRTSSKNRYQKKTQLTIIKESLFFFFFKKKKRKLNNEKKGHKVRRTAKCHLPT